MKYYDIKFITSASKESEWPELNLPEFCLAGRSNVGKSSFINTLVNRKNLAYVGKTPGKTQLLNFFSIDDYLSLVDVPGYGYATRSFNKLINFGEMMEDYFGHREQLKALFLIVDLRHKPTSDDISMIEFAKANHINTIVVATKHDKCKNSDIVKNKKIIAQTLDIKPSSIILFSSLTRYGIEDIWNKIDEIIKM